MGSKGSGQNTVTSSAAPPADVMANYDAITKQANQVAQTPYQAYSGQIVAPLQDTQNQAISGIQGQIGGYNQYANTAQGLIGQGTNTITPSAVNSSAINQYMSPYTQNVINATQAQMNQNNAIQQSSLQGNAAAQGAWGGDRSAVAQSLLAGQQSLANNQTIAGLENQNYSQALNEANTQQQAGMQAQQLNASNALQGAGLTGALGNYAVNNNLSGYGALLNAGGLQQQTAQNQLNAGYQQWGQQQAYPFSTTQWQAGIDSGLGSGMGGTSSTTSPGASAASGMLGGALTGGSLGYMAAPALATAFGMSTGMSTGLGALAGLALLNTGGKVDGYSSGGGVDGYADGGDVYNTQPFPRPPIMSYVPNIGISHGGVGIPHAPEQYKPKKQDLPISGITGMLNGMNPYVPELGSALTPELQSKALMGQVEPGASVDIQNINGQPTENFADGGDVSSPTQSGFIPGFSALNTDPANLIIQRQMNAGKNIPGFGQMQTNPMAVQASLMSKGYAAGGGIEGYDPGGSVMDDQYNNIMGSFSNGPGFAPMIGNTGMMGGVGLPGNNMKPSAILSGKPITSSLPTSAQEAALQGQMDNMPPPTLGGNIAPSLSPAGQGGVGPAIEPPALSQLEQTLSKNAPELNPAMSTLTAGLGMMAGTSPNARVNIGEGGLAGLAQYGQQQEAVRNYAMKQAEVEQKAQQMAVEAARYNKMLEIEQQNADTNKGYKDIMGAAAKKNSDTKASQYGASSLFKDPNDTTNGDISGPDLLDKLTPDGKAQVQGIIDGTKSLKNVPINKRAQISDIASIVDSNFSEGDYDTQLKARKAYTPDGIAGKAITANNTLIHHAETGIQQAYDLANQGVWTPGNNLLNFMASNTGDPRVKVLHDTLGTIASERAKALNPSGVVTDASREEGIKDLAAQIDSPQQVEAVLKNQVGLAGARMNTFQNQFVNDVGNGKPSDYIKSRADSFIQPDSRRVMTKMGLKVENLSGQTQAVPTMQSTATPNSSPVNNGMLNLNDPKVKAAIANGHSVAEIKQHLGIQ